MRTNASYIRIIVFTLIGYFFLNYIGSTGDRSIFVDQPSLWLIVGVIVLFYIAGELSVEALKSILFKTLKPEVQARLNEEKAVAKANQFKWLKKTYKKLLGSKPIEEEHEIILDHNYDGIMELDNNLPPWWVYGFYATIIFAVVYLARYHIFDGNDQKTEYEIAVAEAKLEIEAYKKTAKDLIDVNTVELLTEASDLNAGKSIFATSCVACHKADGGGGIGPNLTDDYWILGGGIKNVFHTISEGGRDGKGMVAWKSDLKPGEIAQVASYVISLHRTTPAEPKDPQGELWVDETGVETPEMAENEMVETTAVK
ncbi:c-type cytochrome [Gillisia sp. M10.2A]|uniref:C-type cytochrome n=1 Tax=Gillisia lutea TaxID=2909668 RepID=A0ABS9EGL7_9FLAO|nr:cbb3-type cytochrome c oxidase N-terminal domain-containing protein [Gillisia lutea]MCF4101407.1 c-type cytochrome [Gillisia lutea]